jgi:glyoxylase-like metal-dependent hydrolase (beta-lactamase superfamily II)
VKFVQYYLECLSQASYLIGDETSGRAVVVDPRRDVQEYLDDAAADGLSIDFVIETHVHADFLSGHLELAAATGATIIYGAGADVHFPHRKVADGERIELGRVGLEFRATPGHTPESICIVVWEAPAASAPYGVLTGDTLFIGDVGRPDLVAAQGRTPGEMAAELYRSLHARVLTLPDATRVYPAHGAGSACGKNLSTETVSTLGEQRRSNYALRLGTAAEFVAAVTEGQPPRPGYFAGWPSSTGKRTSWPTSRNRSRCRCGRCCGGRRTARPCSTSGRPRSSPAGTCAARSTWGSTAASPSTPRRSRAATSSWCAIRAGPATPGCGWPGSAWTR